MGHESGRGELVYVSGFYIVLDVVMSSRELEKRSRLAVNSNGIAKAVVFRA